MTCYANPLVDLYAHIYYRFSIHARPWKQYNWINLGLHFLSTAPLIHTSCHHKWKKNQYDYWSEKHFVDLFIYFQVIDAIQTMLEENWGRVCLEENLPSLILAHRLQHDKDIVALSLCRAGGRPWQTFQREAEVNILLTSKRWCILPYFNTHTTP